MGALTSSVSFHLYLGDLLHFSQVEALCLRTDASSMKHTPLLNSSVEEVEENGSASDIYFGLRELQGPSTDESELVEGNLHTDTVCSFVNLKADFTITEIGRVFGHSSNIDVLNSTHTS